MVKDSDEFSVFETILEYDRRTDEQIK